MTRSILGRLPELTNFVGAVAAFSLVAIVLAAMGAYGVTAFVVATRTREIVVRRALGAGAIEVVRAVGRRAILLVIGGVAAGLLIASWATRYIAAQLVGISATDPWTFVGAAALLALIGIGACIWPVLRALTVPAASVLRAD